MKLFNKKYLLFFINQQAKPDSQIDTNSNTVI